MSGGKSIIIVVSHGNIRPEFVISICKLASKFPDIEVVTGVHKPGEINISNYECVIFMKPEISFPVSSISAIIDDCRKNRCISGIAVPHKRVNFEKTHKIVTSGVWKEDVAILERLSSEFTVSGCTPISLDSSAVMRVSRFQPQDIVCVHGSISENDYNNGFSSCEAPKKLHTRFIVSNEGVLGCLLEQIRFSTSCQSVV